MSYLTELLNSTHKKRNFTCGKKLLDDYLHTQAKQDIKRRLSACFILSGDDDSVRGYYTLSSTSISREILPESIIKKLPPSYHNLPATLLGRLAVDINHKGQRLGELLLLDALKRSYEVSLSSVGSMAIIVDPLDEEAVRFYNKYGFILLPDSGKMFITMDTVSELFK
ncbi:MAG: GNAT family N-acetyltransferase [Bacteroidetes bacterium]|nr:GNAT family N-acetyltransferase [Bacteroidota bacterium]